MLPSRTKEKTVINDRYQPNQRPWNLNGRRDWTATVNPSDKIHIDLVAVPRAEVTGVFEDAEKFSTCSEPPSRASLRSS